MFPFMYTVTLNKICTFFLFLFHFILIFSILSLILISIYRKNKFLMILQHIILSPGRPPNTLFCTTVRIVSPGVLIIAPNTPAQNPNKEVMKKK